MESMVVAAIHNSKSYLQCDLALRVMELRQLEYFVAVAEEQSFTRAADRVHITQSGVSAQIRQLERELGLALLDRSGRRATLTSAGAAALEHARGALAAAERVRQAVDDVRGLLRGSLRMGMVTACTVTPLFDALAAFHHAHPGIEVELAEDTSDLLLERVRAGTLDLALVGTAGPPPPAFHTLPIVSEGIAALVAPGHPLHGRARAPLAEVAAHPVICLPPGTGVRGVYEQACAAAGLAPGIALSATAPDAIADLAARGLGAGILSASMCAGYTADALAAVAIDDVPVPAVLALAWRGDGPVLRALLDRCRAAFAQG
jgi:DNA-binding transcriptional LysR family regulator